jgi:hypothetical protein
MKSFGSSKEFNFGKDIQWDEVGDGVRRQIMAYDDTIMLVNVEFKKGWHWPNAQALSRASNTSGKWFF